MTNGYKLPVTVLTISGYSFIKFRFNCNKIIKLNVSLCYIVKKIKIKI